MRGRERREGPTHLWAVRLTRVEEPTRVHPRRQLLLRHDRWRGRGGGGKGLFLTGAAE